MPPIPLRPRKAGTAASGWQLECGAIAPFQMLVGFALLMACALAVLPARVIAAEDKLIAASSETVTQFDIPSQALEDALYAFGAVTGIAVLVDGSNVLGRQSTAVKGPFVASQALRVLLTGTGLNAHMVGARVVTLSPSQSQERPDTVVYRRYSADLQNAALGRLCSDSEVRPGTYRVAMQLWLDERGRVQRVELLSSTGDQARDRRVRQLIGGISIGKPPPKLPQPITMVILPRSPQDSGDCRAGHGQSPVRDAGDRREGR